MQRKIEKLLRQKPGLKAKAIAAELRAEKKAVNSALYGAPDVFVQDAEYQWFLAPQRELRVDFKPRSWLTAPDFESDLLDAGSPLDATQPAVTFVLAKGTKVMIDALARLLALCNQLVSQGKAVSLDFSQCPSTLTYLDRVGFFNHLHSSIEVLPARPKASRSTLFEGNNDGVVELLEIHPSNPNQNIPVRLGHSFVQCAGERYSVGAFTVLAELFRNVEEHSESTTSGFAGLQSYKRAKLLQAVISDSGIGIVESLRPILPKRYPGVAKKLAGSGDHYGVGLLREVFSEGGLSKVAEKGRGLGLRQSGEVARKYRAKISVRQQDFELRVFHDSGGIRFTHRTGLVRIHGTHMCFELKLDGEAQSG